MAIDNRKSRLHAKRVHWHNVHRMFDEFSLELSLQNVIRRILLCHEPLRLYPREFHRYTVIQFIGDRVSCVCYCKKKKKEKCVDTTRWIPFCHPVPSPFRERFVRTLYTSERIRTTRENKEEERGMEKRMEKKCSEVSSKWILTYIEKWGDEGGERKRRWRRGRRSRYNYRIPGDRFVGVWSRRVQIKGCNC